MTKPLTNRTVLNPLPTDFRFRWDKQWYEIPARSQVTMINYLAEHAAKHLAKKIVIGKGAFVDSILEGKLKGQALNKGSIPYLAECLLDCQSLPDIDVIYKLAKKKGEDAPDEENGEKVSRQTPIQVFDETAKSEANTKVSDLSNDSEDELLLTEFNLLKDKKVWLGKDKKLKERYRELKDMLSKKGLI